MVITKQTKVVVFSFEKVGDLAPETEVKKKLKQKEPQKYEMDNKNLFDRECVANLYPSS